VHPARLFHQHDEATLAALVAEQGLALVVGVGEGGRPLAAHAPVLLQGRRLRFHLSRGNPLAAALADGAPVLAVVTGPDAYVSPDWYGQDDQAPTWNYLSVEMEGPARVLDQDGAIAVLDDLSARFEARLAPKPPWTRHKMTPGRFEVLLGGIVAYEVALTRLEGIWKLGQNKPAEARAGVIAALEAQGEREISGLMRDL
jgi:transcriptional regulator